jgi:hypothetical protein
MYKQAIILKQLVVVFIITFVSCAPDDDIDTIAIEDIPDEEVIPPPTVVENNFIWKNWYLSVPVDRGNGSATSIFYEAIERNNLTSAQSEYFYKNEDGSYSMYTKYTGFTTSGGPFALNDGKYCRTELREFWKGVQSTDDNWSMSTGTHILESTGEVVYCEGSGQTYVAQIHGIETAGLNGSPATVKVQWKNGDLVIEYYVKPDPGKDWTSDFDEKITIGKVDNEKYTVKIKIENGKLYYALVCESKSINIDYTLVYDYVGNGYLHNNYFKTGNYFKWNKDYEKSAKVILHKVKTSHT